MIHIFRHIVIKYNHKNNIRKCTKKKNENEVIICLGFFLKIYNLYQSKEYVQRGVTPCAIYTLNVHKM